MISLPSHPRTTVFLAVKHTETVLSMFVAVFHFLLSLYFVYCNFLLQP